MVLVLVPFACRLVTRTERKPHADLGRRDGSQAGAKAGGTSHGAVADSAGREHRINQGAGHAGDIYALSHGAGTDGLHRNAVRAQEWTKSGHDVLPLSMRTEMSDREMGLARRVSGSKAHGNVMVRTLNGSGGVLPARVSRSQCFQAAVS
jgi:hypothetical protein